MSSENDIESAKRADLERDNAYRQRVADSNDGHAPTRYQHFRWWITQGRGADIAFVLAGVVIGAVVGVVLAARFLR